MANLSQQKSGFTGVVRGLQGETLFLARLRELGIIPGEAIELVGRAPFGEPLLVRSRNMTVALRKQEAACILI